MASHWDKKPYPLRGPSLAESHPKHAKMANGWDPKLFSANSNLVKEWKCNKGHVFQAKIFNFTRPKSEVLCHVCSGRKVLAGYNDLKTLYPEIAKEAVGWDPSQFTAGSNLRKPWKCQKGHEWEVKINSRVIFNSGCPQCAHQKVILGETDLETMYPNVAEQAYGWDPGQVMPGSHQVKDWICQYGHVWPSPINIRVKGSGCPYCRGYYPIIGETDLKTLLPVIAAQADGWDPSTVTVHSQKRKEWRCELGHSWTAVVASRTDSRWQTAACPVCIGQKVLAGFNDLATKLPHLVNEVDGWDPTTVTAGSGKKLAWVCKEGHRWKAQVASRASGRGCPECALYGFKPDRDAWLYLLQDKKRGIMKIGITNDFDERVGLHKRKGFVLIDSLGPYIGKRVRAWEQEVIIKLQSRGIRFADNLELGTFDGYTESWYTESLEVTSIANLFGKLEMSFPRKRLKK